MRTIWKYLLAAPDPSQLIVAPRCVQTQGVEVIDGKVWLFLEVMNTHDALDWFEVTSVATGAPIYADVGHYVGRYVLPAEHCVLGKLVIGHVFFRSADRWKHSLSTPLASQHTGRSTALDL